jgi:hypothetical protein
MKLRLSFAPTLACFDCAARLSRARNSRGSRH